jgi:hypothetical protein
MWPFHKHQWRLSISEPHGNYRLYAVFLSCEGCRQEWVLSYAPGEMVVLKELEQVNHFL